MDYHMYDPRAGRPPGASLNSYDSFCGNELDTKIVMFGELFLAPLEWLADEDLFMAAESLSSYMMLDEEEGWDGLL